MRDFDDIPDLDSLQRAYTARVESVGARAHAEVFSARIAFLRRREELTGRASLGHAPEANEAFEQWFERCVDPGVDADELRYRFEKLGPRLGEHDHVRYGAILRARDAWRAALRDDDLDPSLLPALRTFLIEGEWTTPPETDPDREPLVRALARRHRGLRALAPTWFETHAEVRPVRAFLFGQSFTIDLVVGLLLLAAFGIVQLFIVTLAMVFWTAVT